MYIEEKRKKVISIFLSLMIFFQMIPGLVNFDTANAEPYIKTLENVNEISENNDFMKLEVLKDEEGNPNITEDSITWKIVYNKSQEDLGEQNLKLVLSEHMELEYIDSESKLDIDSQPLFRNELFSSFDSLLSEQTPIEYNVFDENINNRDFIKGFHKVADRTYELNLSETDQTQEIIFTSKLLDEKENNFYAYLLYENEGLELKTSAELKVKPRIKIDIPVNIIWNNVPEDIQAPDTEVELINDEEVVKKVTLVSGSSFTVFEDLYKYDINGKEIDYRVIQSDVEGYDTTVDGYDITNNYIHPETDAPSLVPNVVQGEGFVKELVDSVEEAHKKTEETIEETDSEKDEVVSDEEFDNQEMVESENTDRESEAIDEEIDEITDKTSESIDINSEDRNLPESELVIEDKKAAPTEEELKETVSDLSYNAAETISDINEENAISEERLYEQALDELDNIGMPSMREAIEESKFMETFASTNAMLQSLITPSTDDVLLSSGNISGRVGLIGETAGQWKAYGRFDGNGNIVWTIEIEKYSNPWNDLIISRAFGLLYENKSGSALGIGEGTYQLSTNRLGGPRTGNLGPIGGDIRSSDVFGRSDTSRDTAVYTLTTPIKQLQDSYSLEIGPYIRRLDLLFPQNLSGGRHTLTLQRPIPKGDLTVNLVDDYNQPIPNQRFQIIDEVTGAVYDGTTDSTGKFTQTGLRSENPHRVVQLGVQDGYIAPSPDYKIVNLTEGTNTTVQFVNNRVKFADITVTLESTSAEPLQGATFALINSANQRIGEAVTGADGKLVFSGIRSGENYVVEQLTYPDGYEVSEYKRLYITPLQETGANIKFVNKPKTIGSITIIVKLPDGTPLGLTPSNNGGAEVSISGIGLKRTDAEGKAIYNDLELKREYVVQINRLIVPYSQNYEIPSYRIVKVPSETGQTDIEVEFVLVPRTTENESTIKFITEDGLTGERIPNVPFQLSKNPNSPLTNITTNQNGEFVVNNTFVAGESYSVTPGSQRGVLIDASKFPYNEYYPFIAFVTDPLEEGENTIVIKLYRKPTDLDSMGQLQVNAKDDSGEVLIGARYRLTAVSGAPEELGYVYEGTTDDSGNLYFNTLLPGEYKLEEIQSPFGYVKDATPRTITIPEGTSKHLENYVNAKVVPPAQPGELETIIPQYEKNKTGIDAGEYPIPYHQTDGNGSAEKLYRNRDNIDDGRSTNPNYSIPAYSKHRYNDSIDISRDRDVIEDDRAYLWKTASPAEAEGEYFIDLVVEGKETTKAPSTDIVLILDTSNSMNAVLPGNNASRLANMRAAVENFIENSDISEESNNRIGLVDFRTNVRKVVPLTHDKNTLLDASPTTASGATFTQEALLEANYLLADSEADNKIIILISDGAPTKSFRLNNLSAQSSIDGGWEYTNAFIKEGLMNEMGTGSYYGLGSQVNNLLLRQYDIQNGENKDNITIVNHATATVSEAESIKNHGIEIYSLAVELEITGNNSYDTSLNPDNPGGIAGPKVPYEISSKVLRDVATGDDHFYSVDDSSQIDDILSGLKPITDKTVINGKVKDPMGSQIILGKTGDEFIQTNKYDTMLRNGNYLLDSSDPSLLDNVRLVKNADDTIDLTGLTLGKDEWVKLRYKVNLRTELDGTGNVQDPSFKEQFYLTNGEDTILEPVLGQNIQYKFGVPAIKLPTLDVSINKLWEGFDEDEVPESVTFKLEKSTNGSDWIHVQYIELTKADDATTLTNWNKTIEELILYDNIGNEYEYRISEVTQGNYNTDIDLEMVNERDYKFTATNIAKKGAFIVAKRDDNNDTIYLEGAEFTLYRDIELTDVVESVETANGGFAIFANLKSGTYYLKETMPPDGYQGIDEVITVVVDGEDVIIEPDNLGRWSVNQGEETGNILLLDVFNKDITTDLTLVKVDDNGNPVTTDTATFAIYAEEDYEKDASGKITIKAGAEPVTTVTTDQDGKVTTEKIFKPGNYAVVETQGPEGYQGLEEPFEITLVYDENTNTFEWQTLNTDSKYIISIEGDQYNPDEQELHVVNKKLTKLKVTKVDDKNQPIENNPATFEVYAEEDFTVDNTGKVTINDGATPVTTLVTDANGEIESDEIFTTGKYAIVETGHPSGYIGLTDPIVIELEIDASSGNLIWTVTEGDIVYTDSYGLGIYVVNKPLVYPDTGGFGSIMFTLGGVLLMAAAYVLRKKYNIKAI